MSRFCGNCGAPAQGAAFCGQCGSPLAASPPEVPGAGTAPAYDISDQTVVRPRATPPAPQPGWAQAPTEQFPVSAPGQGVPTQQFGGQQLGGQQFGGQQFGGQQFGGPPGVSPTRQHFGASGQVPRVNPFASTPPSDYVKDAAVVLLVFLSLGGAWSFSYDVVERWWAVVSLLVALLGLAVPYLVASRVVPTLSPVASQGIKAALAAPYVLSVVIAAILDLMTIGGDSDAPVGTGTGLAAGLGAVLLMVQPRACEEALGPIGDRGWRLASAVLAGVVVVATVLSTIAIIVLDGWHRFRFVELALGVLWPFALLAVPMLALVMRRVEGQRTTATIGWTVVVVALLTTLGNDGWDRYGAVTNWATPTPTMWLVAALAAVTVSRAISRTSREVDAVQGWVATARTSLLSVAMGSVAVGLAQVLGMVLVERASVSAVATLLLVLLCGVTAGVAALFATTIGSRVLVTVAAGLVALLGVVLIVVANQAGDSVIFFAGWPAAMFFALPALAVWSVWVPAPVRALTPHAPPVPWGGAPSGQPVPQPWPGHQPGGLSWPQPGQPGFNQPGFNQPGVKQPRPYSPYGQPGQPGSYGQPTQGAPQPPQGAPPAQDPLTWGPPPTGQ